MAVEVEFQTTVRVYEVTVDGSDRLDFNAMADSDGDICIEIEEEDLVEYFKDRYTRDALIEKFDLEE